MTKTQPITPAIAERFVALYDEVARDELEALSGVGAVAAINRAAERSVYTFAGLKDGEPLFLGGVNSEGQVWMLGGPGIAGAKKFYLRETRRQTEIMQAMFPRLWTCVALSYCRSIRWLKWLGFELSEPFAALGRQIVKAERVR